MKLNADMYMHSSDRAALAALKAIPGFSQVVKAYMKIWNEQQFKLINMSTNLRLSENQLGKYYRMLPPICERLGIEIPELYLQLDVNPNAYTYGDTKPAIVMTSGLFETIPEELIPTVLAHECGHIACHHTLYHTIGRTILNGAGSLMSGLGNIAWFPLQAGFAYWMRCSEFSADRAATLYDGGSDKLIEMCMRFSGYDKDIMEEANPELFMQQAEEYKELVNNSTWNKTMEFIIFNGADHPINAVRAYECREWTNSDRFKNILSYLDCPTQEAAAKLPLELNPAKYMGKNALQVKSTLGQMGFGEVSLVRGTQCLHKEKVGELSSMIIDGNKEPENDWYNRDAKIELVYYEPMTDAEIAAAHPGQIMIEDSAKMFIGKQHKEIVEGMSAAGFTNITAKEIAMSKFNLLAKEGAISKISIDGDSMFDKKTWFRPDAEVIIYYYVSVK